VKTIRFKVKGIGCASCILAIKRKLEKLPGLLNVSITLDGLAEIRLEDSANVSVKDIVKLIEEAGYSVELEEILLKVELDVDDERVVSEKLSKLEGVVEVLASSATSSVLVKYNPLQVSRKNIIKLLESSGYKVIETAAGKYQKEISSRFIQAVVLIALGAILKLASLNFIGIDENIVIIGGVFSSIVVLFLARRIFVKGFKALLNLSPTMETLVSLAAGLASPLGVVLTPELAAVAMSMSSISVALWSLRIRYLKIT